MISTNLSGTILNPPDPARIMDGLRDTGYDFNTAIADIVDNSIAAHASRIIIHVDSDPNMKVTVSIADNGTGMDSAGLINAMKYGSEERPDPNSLGKFGLGLKTASTAFCKKLSVASRNVAGGETLKVCWDLDFIAKTNEWNLLAPPVGEDDLDLLYEAAADNPGTLVLWENVDRLFQRSYSNLGSARNALARHINRLKDHLSLVYQRFLNPENGESSLEIYLNDEKISAFDPFCKNEEKTVLLQEQELEINDSVKMMLKAYLLPRKDEFSTAAAAAQSRIGNDTQGFYVYRENRLIHSGGWMNMYKTEPHYSLLRVELSFNHDADDYLNVDIKKSRILLEENIYSYIKEKFLPAPRRAAEQRYRVGTKKTVANAGSGAHDAANKTIDAKAPFTEGSRTTVVNPETNEVTVENKNGIVNTRIKIKASSDSTTCRVIPVESLDNGMLWDSAIVDGKHAVEINMGHPYYEKVYYPLLSRSTSVTGMDALLWALAEAELSTFNEMSKQYFEDMKVDASRILVRLLEDLPEPKLPDYDSEE